MSFHQYMLNEYARLHSVMEQREFIEKMRFLMMAGEKEFSCYYSDISPYTVVTLVNPSKNNNTFAVIILPPKIHTLKTTPLPQ